MDEVAEYWVGKAVDQGLYHCPDVSLFRLIGTAFGPLAGKKVLEIGFGYGADLLECKRRGAEVYGLDLNPRYIEALAFLGDRVRVFRAGTNPINCESKLDLIYFRDLLYYLADSEIHQLLCECRRNLADHGKIIFQFIEADVQLPESHGLTDYTKDLFLHADETELFPKSNPIRFLKTSKLIPIIASADLKTTATKRIFQSYDLEERQFRVDKYMVLSA